jgi:hypothetical protein
VKPIILYNVETRDEGHEIRPYRPGQSERSSEQPLQPAPRITPNALPKGRPVVQAAEDDGKVIFRGRIWTGTGTPEEDSRREVEIEIRPLDNGRTPGNVMAAVPGPQTVRTGATMGARATDNNITPRLTPAEINKRNAEYRSKKLLGGAATQDRASAVPAMSGKRPTIAEINKRNQEFRARKAAGLPV